MTGFLPGDAGRNRIVLRVALTLLLAILAFAMVRNALGLALATRPSGMRFGPGNGVVLAQAALERAQTDQTAAGRAAARDLAQRAIARDPTSAIALTALGLVTPGTRARRLMLASQSLSRRSLYSQLWLIEEAVSRNDIDGALEHYDIALRTSRLAPSILFGVLVEAVGDPGLLPGLIKRLSMRPVWGPLFLQQLAQSGTALDNMTTLFVALRQRGVDVGDPALAAFYPRLIAANEYDDAWRIYAAGTRGASRSGVRGPIPLGTPSPFDWSLVNEDAASIQVEDNGVNYASVIEGGGVGARQLLMLDSGTRMLRFRTRDVIGNGAFLRLECAKGGKEIGRVVLAAGSRVQAVRFAVPSGCDAQWLTVNLSPTASGDNSGAVTILSVG